MKFRIWFVFALFLALPAAADPLLILHTNDLHDHLRADTDGAGGMAYVSSYIRGVKAERDDTIVLDGGDVMEKGDLVVFLTKSKMMYEAMARTGYDAIAPGNHDDAYGLPHLTAMMKAAPNIDFLCINWFDDNGELLFPASNVYERGALKIGVIGMARPRDDQSLDDPKSFAAVGVEAEELDEECHLVVVTCHASRRDCEKMSLVAPKVDVFVSGHSHEALFEPVIVEETGAIIVQAGSYAEYVGRLELDVDPATEDVTIEEGRLVAMDHETIEPDANLVKWLAKKEAELCPEAGDHVIHSADPIGFMHLGILGAAAYREAAASDIAFCHAGQIVRDSLPEGEVNVNTVFRTGGQRGHDVVRTELSGALIEAYINALARNGWGQTQWAGMKAGRVERDGVRVFDTNLDADKTYSVVMALKEWDTRFTRCFDPDRGYEPANDKERAEVAALKSEPSDVTFTSAVVEYLRARPGIGKELKDHIRDLGEAGELE